MVKTLTVLLVCFLVSNASVASPFLKFGKPVEVDNVEYGRLLSEVQTIENCPIVDNEVIDFGAFEAEETLEICLFYLADALGSVAAFERVMGIASIEITSSQRSEFPNNTAYNRPNEHVYNGVYKGAVNEKNAICDAVQAVLVSAQNILDLCGLGRAGKAVGYYGQCSRLVYLVAGISCLRGFAELRRG